MTLVENCARAIPIDRTRRARAASVIIGATVLLAAAILVSATTGALPIPLESTWSALEKGALGRTSLLEGPEIVAWNLRFPRVVMAVLVGACLGGSGAAMQGLFRNPLADPYLLGIAGGASLGATLAFGASGDLGPAFGDAPFVVGRFSGAVPLAASIGAAGAVVLTLLFSRTGAHGRSTSLLLAGVVVGAVLVSLTTYLMLKDADRLRAVVSWSLGNLASSRVRASPRRQPSHSSESSASSDWSRRTSCAASVYLGTGRSYPRRRSPERRCS
jgi:iron complex transport system permease protein